MKNIAIHTVDFKKLRAGDMFMFSMKDRIEFMKVSERDCVSMRQSPENVEVTDGQVVFIKREVL